MLEFAVLGLLHESAMHGYELRKRLNMTLGLFRAFSYGSLYPTLRRMQAAGCVVADDAGYGSRSKVVYSLTAEGKERFVELLGEAGPSTWEDESFGVHFAFFARTSPEARLRILEGRRARLEERQERFRTGVTRTRERLDRYTLELQRHGLESVEREVRWLNELIETERSERSERTERAQGNERSRRTKPAEHSGRPDRPELDAPASPDHPRPEAGPAGQP